MTVEILNQKQLSALQEQLAALQGREALWSQYKAAMLDADLLDSAWKTALGHQDWTQAKYLYRDWDKKRREGVRALVKYWRTKP